MSTDVVVLLIDDDKVDRMKAIEVLAARGIEVEEAADGVEAMQKLHQYDCVIIDYMLPDIDGIALMSAIKNQIDLPCLILTGQGDEVLAVKSLKSGAVDYIPKNEMERLAEAVLSVVRETANEKLLLKYQSKSLEDLKKIQEAINKKLHEFDED